MRALPVLFVALATPLAMAQGFVSPAGYESVEGSSSAYYPIGYRTTSTTTGARQVNFQQVHDDVPAMPISSLYFRRDGSESRFYDIPGYRVEAEVDLSTAATTAATMSTTWTANHGGDKVTVLPRRWIDFPSTRHFGWTPEPFDLPVVFATQFVHGGGSLCYQVKVYDSELQDKFATHNYLDRAYQSSGSTTSSFGTYYGWGCRGSFQYSVPPYAYLSMIVDTANSEVDWYAYHYYMSPGGGNTAMLLGTVRLDIDLGIIGAPGCVLSTGIAATLPMGQSDYRGYARVPASGSATLPFVPSMSGSTVTAQAVSLDPAANAAGIVTSRAYQRMLPVIYPVGLPAAQVYRTGSSAFSSATGTKSNLYATVMRFR